jgi:HK97 family phage prohead protease
MPSPSPNPNPPLPAIERRYLNAAADLPIEIRGTESGRVVRGYAALYNVESQLLGWFVERIAPGAFDHADMSDVLALFNHDENRVLGRNTSGTLRIFLDERGLGYEIDLPDTATGNEVYELIKRGDIRQSSFGFSADVDTWDNSGVTPIRTINRFSRLYDVSPVTTPAYLDTSVAQRSFKATGAAGSVEITNPNINRLRLLDMDLTLMGLAEKAH